MNQISTCVVRQSGGTSPPLPMLDQRDMICFFVTLASVDLVLRSFLLMLTKSRHTYSL